MGLVPERPLVDHQVDRPELQAQKCVQVTGTNGRLLDRTYRFSSEIRSACAAPKRLGMLTAALHGPRYLNLTIHDSPSAAAETSRQAFVGGYTVGVTPVPIPNTVVKPDGPMILLPRESRSLPA